MDSDRESLLDELRTLETELHKDETRRDRRRMERLLHPDFIEFGRSGKRYARADILSEFGQGNVLPLIQSSNFEVVVLSQHVALLTYIAAHVDAEGNVHRRTLRSSIWLRTQAGWQMRFHQGTPMHQSDH